MSQGTDNTPSRPLSDDEVRDQFLRHSWRPGSNPERDAAEARVAPRAWTEEEVREQFLKHVWHMARYWAGLDGSNVSPGSSELDRITGFAHSLLAAIDGCSMPLPGFALTPCPHPDDKQYCIDNGENWFPDDVDIAGGLHELLYAEHIRMDKDE